MPAANVDLVFVVDASGSMTPCFDQLFEHLQEVVKPMQGTFARLRFGLVAHSVGWTGESPEYDFRFLGGRGPEALSHLYGSDGRQSDSSFFFTEDPGAFTGVLSGVETGGNEETLVALDVALDFPFGPVASTKRVIALFSDEGMEGGMEEGRHNRKIPELIEKIMARRVLLFMALPESEGANQLCAVDRAEWTVVDGGEGLARADFQDLLGQMGQSISVSSLQSAEEPAYRRALFGQDRW
ncbi:hypothetical protein ACFL5T_01755 [Gemmatimonadota bacterium]